MHDDQPQPEYWDSRVGAVRPSGVSAQSEVASFTANGVPASVAVVLSTPDGWEQPGADS